MPKTYLRIIRPELFRDAGVPYPDEVHPAFEPVSAFDEVGRWAIPGNDLAEWQSGPTLMNSAKYQGYILEYYAKKLQAPGHFTAHAMIDLEDWPYSLRDPHHHFVNNGIKAGLIPPEDQVDIYGMDVDDFFIPLIKAMWRMHPRMAGVGLYGNLRTIIPGRYTDHLHIQRSNNDWTSRLLPYVDRVHPVWYPMHVRHTGVGYTYDEETVRLNLHEAQRVVIEHGHGGCLIMAITSIAYKSGNGMHSKLSLIDPQLFVNYRMSIPHDMVIWGGPGRGHNDMSPQEYIDALVAVGDALSG